MLCILAVPGWYKTILLKHCIAIDPQPTWESITFHDNMGDDDCARFLAERGLTSDKADDCLDFAYTWIQENNTPEEKETQLRIIFAQTASMATARPAVEPWRKPVLHRFNETHARWVPIVPPPQREASDKNVVTTATARGIGQFTIPLLAEFGQLSLQPQPSTSGSAEPAAMAAETPVEVVAMTTDPPEDPLPPLPESPVIEDEPILVDDDHAIPALAEGKHVPLNIMIGQQREYCKHHNCRNWVVLGDSGCMQMAWGWWGDHAFANMRPGGQKPKTDCVRLNFGCTL
jgi:hypothetical protein